MSRATAKTTSTPVANLVKKLGRASAPSTPAKANALANEPTLATPAAANGRGEPLTLATPAAANGRGEPLTLVTPAAANDRADLPNREALTKASGRDRVPRLGAVSARDRIAASAAKSDPAAVATMTWKHIESKWATTTA
jgi:hypothetical protein